MTLLHVMIVVRFVAGQERHMITGVSSNGVLNDKCQPQGGGKDMAPHKLDSKQRRQEVAEDMLDRMSIDGCPSNRCCEFMMFLMDSFIQILPVQQSVTVVKSKLPADGTDDEITDDFK